MFMITGLILGILLGTGAVTALVIWYNQQQNNRDHDLVLDESESSNFQESTLMLDLPLEKKLRDALYEAQQNEDRCKREIHQLFQLQEDLLKDLGKPSYVQLPSKELFYTLSHPLQETSRYYYHKDLFKDIDTNILSATQQLLRQYQDHIELYRSKIELFQKLQSSHQENLNRINGIQQQHKQLDKIKAHQEQLNDLKKLSALEASALKSEHLLEQIEEELTFQQDCLQQYSQLNQSFNPSFDQQVDHDLKIEIQRLIDQIEDEDPTKKE